MNRPLEPIFEPEQEWELHGAVPNVVFSSASPVLDGAVYVYYGAADRVFELATAPFDELFESARFG
ncbi:MAG: hypothetical protein QGD89_06865 [Actinomycetota bacterium]|nr:hypothetical protein [Actinomycetota bacterium]